MIPYLLLPFWPLFIQYIYKANDSNEKQYNKYLFFAMLPMFLIIALRADYIGADTIVYLRHFDQTLKTGLTHALENTRMEEGYIYFVKYTGYLTTDHNIFQIIYTAIYFIGYFSFARLLDHKVGFLFIYFIITLGLFFFMLTGVRQNIAISICLFSLQFLRKRNIKGYIIVALLMMLAYTFHKSSIIFVLAIMMYIRPMTKFNIFIYTIGLIMVSSYIVFFQDWANENFDYNYEIEETGNGGVFLTIIAIFTILSWYYYKKKGQNGTLVRFLFNVNILTLFLWILRLQTRVAERPSFYFLPISCALFGYMIKYFNKNFIIYYSTIFISYCLFVYRLLNNYTAIIPYKFF